MCKLKIDLEKAYPTAMFYFRWAIKSKNPKIIKKCIKELKKRSKIDIKSCIEVIK